MPNKGFKSIVLLFLSFAIIGVAFKEAFEDGKISGFEVPQVLFVTGKETVKIAKVAPEAIEEATDLDMQEFVQVVKEVQNSPDFKDLNTATVASCIDLGFRQLQIIEDAKAIFTGKPPQILLSANIKEAIQYLAQPSNLSTEIA